LGLISTDGGGRRFEQKRETRAMRIPPRSSACRAPAAARRLSASALFALAILCLVAVMHAQQPAAGAARQDDGGPYRFKSGVELINVTATVSDSSGRFVPGLQREDFVVYEDDQPQAIEYFSAERVPVSLGVVLDTSGSMAGDKIGDARSALDRFVYDLLDERDELFLYRFSDHPVLVQGWTTDRERLSRAMARITPNGGTAMYDAVLEAVPMATAGHHQKKAIVLISDGNDTSSNASLHDVREALRNSEVLMYAIGIDGDDLSYTPPPTRRRLPPPTPWPFPPIGGRPGRPGGRFPIVPQILGPIGGGQFPGGSGDQRVNGMALRDMTDDSGGRTEIVRSARDLAPATTSIADELSRQYSLGYASTLQKDGRWHSIRVEVRRGNYRVRARRGYIAS
jgi:Ca-activated chloride channel family protein